MRTLPAPKIAARFVNSRRVFRRGLLIGLILAGLTGCRSDYAGQLKTINFGSLPGGSATLAYIAQDLHFFADNGLVVNIKDNYSSGAETTRALLKRDIDLAWSAEYPMVGRAFEKQPISIITGTGRFMTEFLIAHKDRGIATISDLKGKTIGVPLKAIAEFYLARFLTSNGLNLQDLKIVNTPSDRALEPIMEGSLDGVISFDPYISQIRTQLGDDAMIWSIQSNQPGYGVICARNDWISTSPEIIKKFLTALGQAEDYMVTNSTAAGKIVQKRLDMEDASMQVFWSEIQAYISLDRSLIIAMEDEARWMMENGLTSETAVPNFLDYIYLDGLKAIRPDAVNIIR